LSPLSKSLVIPTGAKSRMRSLLFLEADKQQIPRRSALRNDNRLIYKHHRQTWRPTYKQAAAAEVQPSFARAVQVKDPDPQRSTETISD
jgi:hypothetical protein